jgi:hypothetical protein
VSGVDPLTRAIRLAPESEVTDLGEATDVMLVSG